MQGGVDHSISIYQLLDSTMATVCGVNVSFWIIRSIGRWKLIHSTLYPRTWMLPFEALLGSVPEIDLHH